MIVLGIGILTVLRIVGLIVLGIGILIVLRIVGLIVFIIDPSIGLSFLREETNFEMVSFNLL